jgi:2-oxoglutarate ferredoxin oxidoreductase subunit gamma
LIEKSFFAGFGGQGIVSLGQIWVYCAMKEGKNVTFFPFYGAEKRGGIARANIVVSDDEIASPLVSVADSAIAMNGESVPLCRALLREDGLLLVNSNLADAVDAKNIRVVPIAAQDIAEKSGGFANMVALGALARLTSVLALTEIEAILKDFFPPSKHKFIPSNIRAIEAGWASV